MNKRSRESLDAYYKEAESWSGDRQQELRKSRKVAWMVAAGACAVAMLLALVLVLLVPLKTERVVTLLVDRNTGFVQAIRPLEEQRISADSALTQSLLVQYVVQRESFDVSTVQSAYRHVTLWSAGNARSEYMAGMQASNPQSPLVRYPRGASVETFVRSVLPESRNRAAVRFETRLRAPGGQVTSLGAWVATVEYQFTAEPMRQEDRFTNPLGFQVTRYRKSQEALPPPPEPVQPAQPGLAVPQPGGQPTVVAPGVQRPQAVVPPQQAPQPQRNQPPPQPEVEL
ncbi:MAG TPA: type IV secretion system protein [Allosphingosinicella sp.]|jgi:type IV secretion system protein VirB8